MYCENNFRTSIVFVCTGCMRSCCADNKPTDIAHAHLLFWSVQYINKFYKAFPGNYAQWETISET